jgi:ABC-type sugar transport system ATPase subunit
VDVSFSLRAGEIVGLAGLVGAGRSEVARTIFGAGRPQSGGVSVDGAPVPPGSIPAAIVRGIALVPEDRQADGLVLPLTVHDNLVLAVLRELARGVVRARRRETEVVAGLIKDLSVRAASPLLPAMSLSGGNQQKLVLGKWLAARPRVLLLDEPTRGVDVGAKAEIYRLIRRLAEGGMATLLISSDLPELLAMSDRVLVMRRGRLVGELPREEATEERVLALALGETAEVGAA